VGLRLKHFIKCKPVIFVADLKRLLSILVLLSLIFSYTGVQLCVDFCGDTIESIHFGEDKSEAVCHLGDCGPQPMSDCCDSEQIQIEPHLLDYTVTLFSSTKMPFAYVKRAFLTDATHIIPNNQPIYPIFSKSLVSTPVRALTQVSLC
jgi:hypothetical protein